MIKPLGTTQRRVTGRTTTVTPSIPKRSNEIGRIPLLEILAGERTRDPWFAVAQKLNGPFLIEEGMVIKLRWSDDIDPYSLLNAEGDWPECVID